MMWSTAARAHRRSGRAHAADRGADSAATALWLKCECLQTGGAFKLRGASNRLLQLSADERARGVVAFSSGNHAQGVAIAARRLGMPAMIVMPTDAPALKVEGTRAQGAEIVFYDRAHARTARQLPRGSRRRRARPSCRASTIRTSSPGRGRPGSKSSSSSAARRARIVVPCGGGGLAAGIALACPEAAISIVEPEGWDDMARSLRGGAIVPVGADAPPTLCDALQTPRVSPITFGVLRERGATALSVSDEEACAAIALGVARASAGGRAGRGGRAGGGAGGQGRAGGGRLVVVVSGGNIDPALHARIVVVRRRGRYRRARGVLGLDRSTARVSSSSSAASVWSSAASALGSSSARLAEASSKVSSIIAMHGRIVSSMRLNASSRRACCCSIVAMARDHGANGLKVGERGPKWGRLHPRRWRWA